MQVVTANLLLVVELSLVDLPPNMSESRVDDGDVATVNQAFGPSKALDKNVEESKSEAEPVDKQEWSEQQRL